MSEISALTVHECCGGKMGFYVHQSVETRSEMRFAVFVPPQASKHRVPALYFLAGLSCTEETFMIKANAQWFASARGLVLVACDTSPRRLGPPWDFNAGEGFYVDATIDPWARHYRMYSYVTRELPNLIEEHFLVIPNRRGIFGHSMGGHGALISALRNPHSYISVSAFAPIANPIEAGWGKRALTTYLGAETAAWQDYDASRLMRQRAFPRPILIDQGTMDEFLESQLQPHKLEVAANVSGQPLVMRKQPGYDHSYWFIKTFVADHIEWHAKQLAA
jgi:S-formylglutathione hydrolase